MKALVLRAWGVHLYTALGLLCAMFAIIGLFEGNAKTVFAWLGAALVIDSTDGMMARRFEVSRWVPRFDGRKLDDITDYINYVLVPVVGFYRFGLIGNDWLWVLGLVLLASGYGFNMDVAKTDDGYFTGFPSYWNVALFYAFLFQWPAWINGLFLLGLAILVFVPIKYLYPSKTRVLKPLNQAMTAVWMLVAMVLVINLDKPNPVLLYGSLISPAYYVGLSLILYFRQRAAPVAA